MARENSRSAYLGLDAYEVSERLSLIKIFPRVKSESCAPLSLRFLERLGHLSGDVESFFQGDGFEDLVVGEARSWGERHREKLSLRRGSYNRVTVRELRGYWWRLSSLQPAHNPKGCRWSRPV